MKKFVVASVLAVFAFTPAFADDDAIKAELALGCSEKEVAKTVAAEMSKYVNMFTNKDKVQFTEDCEVFIKGDSVIVTERPEDGLFVKAQRPAQIKSFWIPASALIAEEKPAEPTEEKKEEKPAEKK
ncbi:MAG: hypothetical protein ACRBBN_01705 [Methyloligellaceae bacterium]